MTAAKSVPVIIAAYSDPIAFMNNIVCGVYSEPEPQDSDDSMPTEPAQHTWMGWFLSISLPTTVSKTISWVNAINDISRCPGTYLSWMVVLSVLGVVLFLFNKIPYVGRWVNPFFTVIAIGMAAKGTLDWIHFWWIVLAVLIYAVMFSLGLSLYYYYAKHILTGLKPHGRDPYSAELHNCGDVFEDVQHGLVVTQIVVGFYLAVNWCIVLMN